MYRIIKTKTVGHNRGKTVTVATRLRTIEEAGQWLVDNSIEEFGPYIQADDEGKALVDVDTDELHDVIFEIGDTRLPAGGWLYDIVEDVCDGCGLPYNPANEGDTVCEHCGEAMLEAWNEEEK